MDRKLFTANSPGTLVRISVPRDDWAFVPEKIPTKWEPPGQILDLLMEAREETARLDGLSRLLPDPMLLIIPLQRREALRSSSLEGTFASPEQLIMFELNPEEPKSERDPVNAWKEVSNYIAALRQGLQLLETLPLCLRLVKEMHGTLLRGVRGGERAPGEFRRTQVYVGSDYRYIPPPPNRLAACLDEFEKEMNQTNSKVDNLIRCYLLHYKFEAIHPFLDGNGRVGRVLLSLMIYKWCRTAMPILYMSAFFEKHKDEYLNGLFKLSTHGGWDEWVKFCLIGTIEQARDSFSLCEGLHHLKLELVERVQGAGSRAHALIGDLFRNPVITIPEVVKRHNVTYPTARTDVEKFVALGILRELEHTHPKAYFVPEIFRIAFRD